MEKTSKSNGSISRTPRRNQIQRQNQAKQCTNINRKEKNIRYDRYGLPIRSVRNDASVNGPTRFSAENEHGQTELAAWQAAPEMRLRPAHKPRRRSGACAE